MNTEARFRPRILFWLATLPAFFACGKLNAQMQTSRPATIEEMVRNMFVGEGIEVSNVQYTCVEPDSQIMQFEIGPSGPAMLPHKGILMCTGYGSDAQSDNTNYDAKGRDPHASEELSPNYYTELPELRNLVIKHIYDVAILEFDFVSKSNRVEFRYSFASEEYAEYVGEPFNDVFGFFISGPGIEGQQNIALIPNTTLPVAINNVNHAKNNNYYISNQILNNFDFANNEYNERPLPERRGKVPIPGPHQIEYDGFTLPLTAYAEVVPCQTYHLKLAIADVADAHYDSAVLLEEGSFSATGYQYEALNGVASNADSTITLEGCESDVKIRIQRTITGEPETVPFALSGTATQGADYTLSSNEFRYGPNDEFAEISLNALPDALPEGRESLTLRFKPRFACDSLELTVYIGDMDTTLNINPGYYFELCEARLGSFFPLEAETANDNGRFAYEWRDAEGNVVGREKLLNWRFEGDETLLLTATDRLCNLPPNQKQVEYKLLVSDIAFNLKDTSVCANETFRMEIEPSGGLPPYTVRWQDDQAGQSAEFNFAQNGTITARVTDRCEAVEQTSEVTVRKSTLVPPAPQTICSGDSVDAIAVANGNATPWRYYWLSSEGDTLSHSDSLLVENVLTDKTYIAVLLDDCGVKREAPFNITVRPELKVTLPDETLLCVDEAYEIQPEIEGAGSYAFEWRESENGEVLSNARNLTGTASEDFTAILYVSDLCASDTAETILNVLPAEFSIAEVELSTDFPTCKGSPFSIDLTLDADHEHYRIFWNNRPGTWRLEDVLEESRSYTASITDGCQVIDTTFHLSIYPELEVYIPDTFLCDYETVAFSPVLSGGDSAYAKPRWSDSNGNLLGTEFSFMENSDTSRTLYFSFEDGCETQAGDTVNVVVYPKPEIELADSLFICEGESIQLSANMRAGANCDYTWTPSVALNDPELLNPIAQPNETTTYALVAECDGCVSDPAEVVVRVFPNPTIAADQLDHEICARQDSALLEVVAQGGTGALRYNWSPESDLSQADSSAAWASPLLNHVYEVWVEDSAGCRSPTLRHEVAVRPRPTVSALGTISRCANDAPDLLEAVASISSGATLNYQWSPSEGLSDPNALQPETAAEDTIVYTLTVWAEETGCAALDTPSIVVNVQELAVSGLPDETQMCLGDSVFLDAAPSKAGPDYTYEWTPDTYLDRADARVVNIKAEETTTLTLTIFSNGCASEPKEVEVNVTDAPLLLLSEDASICPYETARLEAEGSGARGPFSYEWTPQTGLTFQSESAATAQPEVTTTYTVTLRAEDCLLPTTATVGVEVLPIPEVRADATETPGGLTILEGDTIEIPAEINAPVDFSVEWRPVDSLDNPNKVRPLAFPVDTTAYIVRAAIGRCFDEDTVVINVKPLIRMRITEAKDNICRGDSVLLRASGNLPNAHFEWTGPDLIRRVNDSTIWARPQFHSTYKIVAHSPDYSSKAEDSVRVIVQDLPIAAFESTRDFTCNNLKVDFEDFSIRSYSTQWLLDDELIHADVKAFSRVFPQAGAFEMKQIVRSIFGCKDTVARNIVIPEIPPLRADFASSPELPGKLLVPRTEISVTQTANRGQEFYWEWGDGATGTGASAAYAYPTEGEYYVSLRVVDSLGCVDSVRKGPIRIVDEFIDIPNVFTPNGDGFNDEWIAEYSGDKTFQCSITDRWGGVVFRTQNPTQRWDGRFNGSQAPEGAYFYHIVIGGDRVYSGSLTLVR